MKDGKCPPVVLKWSEFSLLSFYYTPNVIHPSPYHSSISRLILPPPYHSSISRLTTPNCHIHSKLYEKKGAGAWFGSNKSYGFKFKKLFLVLNSGHGGKIFVVAPTLVIGG
jgi:hypothetical protein